MLAGNMSKEKNCQPRLRVLIGQVTALGPGKASLLEAIDATGSISAAARQMGMSYRRAWNLVDSMNGDFVKPVVKTNSGGKGGGGASVTKFGKEIIERYREIEELAIASVESQVTAFGSYLNLNETN